MSQNEYILNLVREAIHALDTEQAKLSVVLRTCIRIARLRNDFYNLIWLQREIIDNSNEYERSRAFEEITPHFEKGEFDFLNKTFLERWMKERPAIQFSNGVIEYPDDHFILKNVSGFEAEIEGWSATYQNSKTPPGLHNEEIEYLKLRSLAQAKINHYRSILENIKNRVYDFLSMTEKQLVYGQIHADVFEVNRQYVELRLGQVCPEALQEFVAANQGVRENNPETRAQALLSCRRLLKDLADVLYPPPEQPVAGVDGRLRDLSEEKYISRLWQFLYEQTAHSTSAELLMATIEDLGHRVDRLYELTNKGVHAEVGEFEANQCLIQTYLIVGDLLRVLDKQSAIGQETTL